MMTSKEALYKILDKYETYHNIECCEEYFDLIEQDLERLEKLEEENKKLRTEIKSVSSETEEQFKKFLDKKNQKHKKVIEILKDKTIIIFALKLSKDLSDYNRMTSFENLTQEEYDLLKEVIQ